MLDPESGLSGRPQRLPRDAPPGRQDNAPLRLIANSAIVAVDETIICYIQNLFADGLTLQAPNGPTEWLSSNAPLIQTVIQTVTESIRNLAKTLSEE